MVKQSPGTARIKFGIIPLHTWFSRNRLAVSPIGLITWYGRTMCDGEGDLRGH